VLSRVEAVTPPDKSISEVSPVESSYLNPVSAIVMTTEPVRLRPVKTCIYETNVGFTIDRHSVSILKYCMQADSVFSKNLAGLKLSHTPFELGLGIGNAL